MEFRHLAYFEAVARLGHITRAANELHVAQPSVSKQIQALEAELGVRLFDRVGRRIELSDAGALLLPYARRILRDVSEARAALQQRADLAAGRVSLGAPPTVGAQLLPRALADFNARYHGIELELHEAGGSRLAALLAEGTVDLAVVPLPVADVAVIQLLTEELVIAVSPGHRWAGERAVDARQLAEEDFILFPPGYELRDRTLQLCQQAGFAPRIVLDGAEMNTVLRLTAAGLGIALVPQLALDDRPDLVGVHLRDMPLVRTLGLIWHPERLLSPAAQALKQFLLEQLQRDVA